MGLRRTQSRRTTFRSELFLRRLAASRRIFADNQPSIPDEGASVGVGVGFLDLVGPSQYNGGISPLARTNKPECFVRQAFM